MFKLRTKQHNKRLPKKEHAFIDKTTSLCALRHPFKGLRIYNNLWV